MGVWRKGRFMKALVGLLLLVPALCPAATLYSNIDQDKQFSAVYSATGATAIGDEVQLVAPATLTSLSTQFYNVGTDATFSVDLNFYEVGSPVGNQIGGTFTRSGLFIPGSTSLTVTFGNLGNLAVPRDLVVMFTVYQVSAGGDLGLNLFDPPGTGISLNTFYVELNGGTFSQVSTLNDFDNLYLDIEGTATVPEPGTAALTLGSLTLLAWYGRRRG